MIKETKIRSKPTPEQAVYFAKAAGTARFVWNWALAEWNRQYEAGEKPTTLKLKKQFNEISRFSIWARRLRTSLKHARRGKRKGDRSSKARREAKQAFTLPMINSSLGIIASGYPNSDG